MPAHSTWSPRRAPPDLRNPGVETRFPQSRQKPLQSCLIKAHQGRREFYGTSIQHPAPAPYQEARGQTSMDITIHIPKHSRAKYRRTASLDCPQLNICIRALLTQIRPPLSWHLSRFQIFATGPGGGHILPLPPIHKHELAANRSHDGLSPSPPLINGRRAGGRWRSDI